MVAIKKFIADIIVIDLESAIKHKTIIVRSASPIKLPDAIIAATAMVYDLTLVTRNTADFNKVEGLKLIDPFVV